MIQYITADVLPASPRWSRYCLTNPDFLLRAASADKAALTEAVGDKFSLVLHDLRMGGAWKRTRRGRLRETERALCEQLADKKGATINLLDIGASDGVTTWEAVQALRQELQADVRALLADLHLHLLRYRSGMIVEYRAGDGEPILARLGRFGLRLSKQRQGLDATVDPLVRWYLALGLRESLALEKKILLIHPLAQAESAITALELNCLERNESLVGTLDAVRASNVLNLGYFTPEQISTAVGHLHAYLREGGCLVISRNNDTEQGEIERGSVWRKRGEHFEHVEDFGNGSEVKEVVNAWHS